MTAPPGRPHDSARVIVVEAPACHFCAEARAVLDVLAAEYPLQLEVVDIRSDRGRELVAAHRPALNPLVLLDGEFFSNGRLPRRKLDKLLAQRFGTARRIGAV